MEEIDFREEGEVDSDEPEANVYKTIERPQQNFRPLQKLMDSDSQSSDNDQIGSNSDDEEIKKKAKIKSKIIKPSIHQRVNPPSKNGNLWRSMLQEECLTENLQTFDVSTSRKRQRGAESYDFESHRSEVPIHKRKKFEKSSNDSSSSNASNKSREKRKIKKAKHRNRNKHPLQTPKLLPNILISFNTSDEEYGQMMAKNLEEEKSDLIIRVVSVIGKDESLKLYTNTQQIEKNGGMMTINKQRRRTPGGIFLWLLKTSSKIDETKKKEIFEGDKDKQMSEGNWSAKTDPPPPSPAGEISTNNSPDPNVVSQKILSSIPDEDILELDFNENDMDTF